MLWLLLLRCVCVCVCEWRSWGRCLGGQRKEVSCFFLQLVYTSFCLVRGFGWACG